MEISLVSKSIIILFCLSVILFSNSKANPLKGDQLETKWNSINGNNVLKATKTLATLKELSEILSSHQSSVDDNLKDQVEKLLAVGNLPKDACDSKTFEDIHSLYSKYQPDSNLAEYLKNCKTLQSNHCTKCFMKKIAELTKEDQQKISQLVNGITNMEQYQSILDWNNFDTNEKIRGLLAFLELESPELLGENIQVDKENFENKFKSIIVGLCERVKDKFDLAFYRYDHDQKRSRPATQKGWITKAMWCNSILESKTELIESTYNLFNERKSNPSGSF